MSKDSRKILAISAISEGEIREIGKKYRFGKIEDVKTRYYPYIYFTFSYDEMKGILHRRSIERKGESVLDSSWYLYPVTDFEKFFKKNLVQPYAGVSEETVSVKSVSYAKIDDPTMVVKGAFEAIMNYVSMKEGEFASRVTQTKESTKGLLQEAGRLARSGHVLTARIISDRVKFARGSAEKEQNKFLRTVSKKFRKCFGADAIKKILTAEIFYCPRYILMLEDGNTSMLDHEGREISQF